MASAAPTNRVLGYRGQQVHEFVTNWYEQHGRCPSYGTIRDMFGFSSKQDVYNVMRRLEQRGLGRFVDPHYTPQRTSTSRR